MEHEVLMIKCWSDREWALFSHRTASCQDVTWKQPSRVQAEAAIPIWHISQTQTPTAPGQLPNQIIQGTPRAFHSTTSPPLPAPNSDGSHLPSWELVIIRLPAPAMAAVHAEGRAAGHQKDGELRPRRLLPWAYGPCQSASHRDHKAPLLVYALNMWRILWSWSLASPHWHSTLE